MSIRIRFSSRLILSVVLIEAVMLSLLVWNSARLINQSHSELLEKYVSEQSALLALSLQPGLISNDRALLRDALSLVKDYKQIIYVDVLNREGTSLASIGTSPTNNGYDANYFQAKQDGIYDIQLPVELYGQTVGTLKVGYAIDYVQHLTDKTLKQNSLIAALELFLTINLTVLVGLFLTKNLRKLETGAIALSHKEWNHRIKVNSNDEISDVADAFNNLAENLEISNAKLLEQHNQIVEEKHRIETLLNNINAVIMEADPTSLDFSYVSQEAEKLLAISLDEWLQHGFWPDHIHPDDKDTVISTIQSYKYSSGETTIDYRLQHHNGEYVWVRHILSFERDDNDKVLARGLIIDIHEQKVTEQRILFLANHDSLTGMYNRHRFQDNLGHQIAYAKRFQLTSALLFVDLDQFKFINDTLGHQAGDECLASAANVIRSSLREIDIVGRLGGDEFGVILPNVDDESAIHVAEHLIKALETKVNIPSELSTRISASIGITIFPEHGSSPAEILAKADAAMYSIKRSGRGHIHVYQRDDNELNNMKEKVHWEDKITRALKDDNFVLHYQPILNIKNKIISHHEVLLRMRDDNGDLIYPGVFLSTAERFGLIREVDQWVINNSIRVQGQSIRDGRPVSLAINLSGRHFGDPDFMTLVQSAIHEYKADPRALMFEVTETAAVENLATARNFVENLRELGCRFALDDFGMGYSSFHYLKNLPVDTVKIDGSFIRNLHQNTDDVAIVKAISDLTQGMGITTVAEFVENEQILDKLEIMGIDYAQGFYIAMPTEHFIYEYIPEFETLRVSPD